MKREQYRLHVRRVHSGQVGRVTGIRDPRRAVSQFDRRPPIDRDPLDDFLRARLAEVALRSRRTRFARLRDARRRPSGSVLPDVDFAHRGSERGANDFSNRAQRILSARRFQTFRSKRREALDFGRAALRRRRLSPCAGEELCRDQAGEKKGCQHRPVEGVGNRQRVVGQQEEEIEAEKCGDRHRNAECAPTSRAGAEHDEQVRERHVCLIQRFTNGEQRDRGCGKHDQSYQPYPAVREHGDDHSAASKRYPTPGSVMMMAGRTGSGSSLRRRLAI